MHERIWIAIAGLSGAAAVIADTIAAHAVYIARSGPYASDLMIGARYGLLHAAALLGVALLARMRGQVGRALAFRALGAAGWCFALGLLLFPPSLYLLGLGAPRSLGWLAPPGGTLFIAGWLALLFFAVAPRPADASG
jgi:uncharacterized membrane protein YgdD (TMEM256/DUF423 family)